MREVYVLITRAMPQALRTAQAIEKIGACPVLLPLTEIVPLDAPPPSPVGFDGLIASSANAFNLLQKIEDWHAFHARPLFCVGQQTAYAARQAGFSHIAAIADDAENLANLLKNNRINHFLYLAGRYRRPLLEEALQKQGKDITLIEIYDQRPIMPDITHYRALHAPVDYVLLYSTLAAKQLSTIMLPHSFAKTTKFLCLSTRIAKALPQDYAAHSIIARTPSEAVLLASLKQNIQLGKRL